MVCKPCVCSGGVGKGWYSGHMPWITEVLFSAPQNLNLLEETKSHHTILLWAKCTAWIYKLRLGLFACDRKLKIVLVSTRSTYSKAWYGWSAGTQTYYIFWFYLMVQSGWSRFSQHTTITTNRKEERGKKDAVSLFRDISWKLYTFVYFPMS